MVKKCITREYLRSENREEIDELFEYVIEVANGKQTNNEKNGYKEISIFKDGVVL